MKIRKFNLFFLYFIIVIYLELLFKGITFNNLLNIGTLYSILLAIPIAIFLDVISHMFKPKANKFITFIIVFLLCFLFGFHYIHYRFFSIIFSFYSLGFANQVLDFFDVLLGQIIKSWYVLILLFMPFISLIVFRKKVSFQQNPFKKELLILGIFILSLGINLLLLLPTKKVQYGPYEMFFLTNDPTVSVESLGVVTTTILDFKRTILGFEDKKIYEPTNQDPQIDEEEKQEYNMTNIDFDAMIANENDESIIQMHNYFKSETPTLKNSYTGIYKGKNLVFFIAEGFNEIAVKENVTPTLYKLVHEGFFFENFYTPINLSTTGGEYQAMNAAIVTNDGRNAWYKGDKYLPYSIGNAFAAIDYNTYAYHDWTYSYYGRQKTMPELGFSNYLACGNGLQKLMSCNGWPISDLKMVDVTTDFFLNKENNDKPFVTYYFTVSGHTHYNWMGNNIAYKNRSLTNGLEYSETAKAYLATQIELDKALELLIQRLTEAGELENTVIALVGDHHPYQMATGVYDIPDLTVINELSDREEEKDAIIEINRSNFILWNSVTPSVTISKTASQIDVLPTILNLFGVEYDSRLLIGKDILSEAQGLAIFSNRSWVSDKGKYYSSTRTFVPKEGVTVSETYVEEMNKIISNKFAMSSKLMTKDYYRVVLGS